MKLIYFFRVSGRCLWALLSEQPKSTSHTCGSMASRATRMRFYSIASRALSHQTQYFFVYYISCLPVAVPLGALLLIAGSRGRTLSNFEICFLSSNFFKFLIIQIGFFFNIYIEFIGNI